MDIRKLQRLIVDALEDVKAVDIKVFNSTTLTQLFDRVVIASGTSNRQTRALAASVRDKVKAAGGHVISVEGEETGEWVLVDLGDAIVHVMQPAIRQYYNLEEIWGAKPVSMKSLDDEPAGTPRVAREADEGRKAVAKKTLVAKKAPAVKKAPAAKKTVAAKKTLAAKKSPAAKKAAPRAPARKTQAPH